MPFNQHDIYTSSGSVKLFNEWVPYVSKFDTSSFYNWEQDNLPLYDLEERTYELWEQNGFNTSAGVPGLSLTVSSDAPAATLAANRNVFTELSSCIAAIPKVIRFPVLVEVGTIGDLGNLELHNFRIEEGGSLEIVNRSFARVYDLSSEIKAIVAEPAYNKSHAMVTNLSSLDTSNALEDASCVHLNEGTVIRADGDTRTNNETHRVVYPKHTTRNAPLTVAINGSLFANSNPDQFLLQPYENVDFTSFDDTLHGTDVSALNQSTAGFQFRSGVAADDLGMGGNTYLNKLGKITIKNCDGPIYVRNFFVDAAKDAAVNDYGIEVVNSEAVIENCAAIRANEAGWKFNNAKVTLSRSAFAYRNYKLTSTTTRQAETGYGFHAVNSDISISAAPIVFTPSTSAVVGDVGASGADCKVIASRNYAGIVLDNSRLTGGVQRAVATEALDGSILGSELNTGYGALLDNSKIEVNGLIDLYGNDKGIQADNSKVKFQNLCIDGHAGEAIRCRGTQFIFDSVTSPTNAGQADRKQLDMSSNGQHIDLQGNSMFTFRRKNNMPTTYGNSKFVVAHGVIKWGGSNRFALPAFSINDGSQLDLIHPNILVNGTTENVANVPSYGRAIKATNSSKVSLFGTGSGCNFVFGPAGLTYQKKMAGIYGSNNSTINLHGPTAMAQFGVDVLVEDNSVLNIEPARKRDDFALEVSGFDLSSGANHTSVELHATRACLVANKNSTINLQDLGAFPANWVRTSTGRSYIDTIGTDYPIETFNTSAYTSSGCLQFYPNPQDTSTIDYYNLDDITNAASLNYTIPSDPVFAEKTGLNRLFITDEIINSTPNYTTQGKITQGGVALRATEDSVVNVKNVHFPLGTNGSPLDGFYYTTSGSECDRFGIWNIADTSRLNASYISVSGMHPASIQYHGPSALWASSSNGEGTGNDYDAPASGAPSGTPGTGTLSVLDVFGAGSGVWVIPSGVDINSTFNRFYPVSGPSLNIQTAKHLGQAGINVSGTETYKIGATPHTSENQGCFRIYWTPKSSARVLQTDLSGYHKGAFPYAAGPFSGAVGPAYQLFAQGYNCSAPLSALVPTTATNASGEFPDLLRLSHDSNNDGVPDKLWTSGFYYCSEMLDENPTQCILDESAAKTFANAQNASVNLGGTPRKVTLVRARADSTTNRASESYVGDASGSLGFKSAAVFDLSRDN